MANKPYNFIDKARCSCSSTKFSPVLDKSKETYPGEAFGYICSSCRKHYDNLGNAISALDAVPEETLEAPEWNKKCLCGEGKLLEETKLLPSNIPADEITIQIVGYTCSECRKRYTTLGEEIVSEVSEEAPQLTLGFCPFMSKPPEAMVECISGRCHLWSDSTPFYGLKMGMCSIVLAGEAMAFTSRGEQSQSMGER